MGEIIKPTIMHKIPVTLYSGGTSIEGNFRAVQLTTLPRFFFFNCSVVVAYHLQHSGGDVCIDMPRVDISFKIHGGRIRAQSVPKAGLTSWEIFSA